MNKPLKLTMKTPGREITINLPDWITNRIVKMFMAEVQRQDRPDQGGSR